MDDKIITSSADALKHKEKIHEVKNSQPGTLHELALVNISFSFKGMQKVSSISVQPQCFTMSLYIQYCELMLRLAVAVAGREQEPLQR